MQIILESLHSEVVSLSEGFLARRVFRDEHQNFTLLVISFMKKCFLKGSAKYTNFHNFELVVELRSIQGVQSIESSLRIRNMLLLLNTVRLNRISADIIYQLAFLMCNSASRSYQFVYFEYFITISNIYTSCYVIRSILLG